MSRFRLTRLSTLVCLGATLLLAGCQTVFDLVGVEEPLSASQARSFDGSYQGDISQVPTADAGCPAERGEKVVMIGDGVLWYAYSPSQFFTAAVRYDGTIAAASGTVALSGKISGNHVDLVLESPTCRTTLSLNYIYNHS